MSGWAHGRGCPEKKGNKKKKENKKDFLYIYFYEIIKCKHPRRPTWYFTDRGFGTTAAIEGCDKKIGKVGIQGKVSILSSC